MEDVPLIFFSYCDLISVVLTCLVGLHTVAQPETHFKTGRHIRMTPLYPRLREMGAVFRDLIGFERASHYDNYETNIGNCEPCLGVVHRNPIIS